MSLIWGGLFLLMLVELAVVVMLLVPMPDKLRGFLARGLRAIYHMKHVKFVFFILTHTLKPSSQHVSFFYRYVGGATLAFVVIMFAEAFTDGTSASVCSFSFLLF